MKTWRGPLDIEGLVVDGVAYGVSAIVYLTKETVPYAWEGSIAVHDSRIEKWFFDQMGKRALKTNIGTILISQLSPGAGGGNIRFIGTGPARGEFAKSVGIVTETQE